LVLEEISQQLVKSKHTFMLGQFFKIVPNLKLYVATNITLGRKNIIVVGPNPIITLVVIDLHMAMIQFQVGKNIIKDVLSD
jgi:hypothetical protein